MSAPSPEGLTRCEMCGEFKGTWVDEEYEDDIDRLWVVECLCDGVACTTCGTRKHRPLSNYWDEERGHPWHVPWFEGIRPCGNCGASRQPIWRSSRPDPSEAT